ncbi:hypothetical protein [Nocardia vaccinii]|nr:hypothetical protein [Nocardia vaccinii]
MNRNHHEELDLPDVTAAFDPLRDDTIGPLIEGKQAAVADGPPPAWTSGR